MSSSKDELLHGDEMEMKLAIVVVYYLGERDIPLLRLHLDRIRRHTSVPYMIYGKANRISPPIEDVLREHPALELVDTPTRPELRASAEHGYYLQKLTTHALTQNSTHICTLDVDSFPIRDGWVEELVRMTQSPPRFAAILRAENGDTDLPHPSCIFFHRSFAERWGTEYHPLEKATNVEYTRFRETTGQSLDTGASLGYALWRGGQAWPTLCRTNRHNEHYLLGGVYGDLVFHLGSAGWTERVYRADVQRNRILRLTEGRLAPSSGGKRLMRRAVQAARVTTYRRTSRRNTEAYEKIRDALLADPDNFVERARHGESSI